MIVWAILNIGYYNTYWAEDNKTVFFIKKEMTLQVKFENLFATDRDIEQAHELNERDRQDTIDYCRYHLGYQTQLKTQSDLDGCYNAYRDSFKKTKH